MSDALYVRGRDDVRATAAAAVSPADVWQMGDGRAAVYQPTLGAVSGDRIGLTSIGQFTMPKTASVVLLDGQRAYWDYSALSVTFRKVNDRDFYLGRIVGDCASADTTCVVNLNVDPKYDIDLQSDAFLSVPTGTQAVGAFGFPKILGGAQSVELTATNEAQCIDLLSVNRVAIVSNPIFEAEIRIPVNGSTSDVDFNIGLADGTSTTDADAIATSCFFHIDGGALDIFAESDDGTTEVAATDTTVNATAGSAVANRIHLMIDARNPADVQMYIDGVLVLGSSVFVLTAGAAALGILVHLEKVSGTATGRFVIDRATVRIGKQ